MENVTSRAQQGPVSLKSAQTATLFPGRSRNYRTGVTADDVEVLGFEDPDLENVRVGELLRCPVTGEILVALVNEGKMPFLVQTGSEVAVVETSKPAGRVLELTTTSVIEFNVEMEEAADEDGGMTETFRFDPVDDAPDDEPSA